MLDIALIWFITKHKEISHDVDEMIKWLYWRISLMFMNNRFHLCSLWYVGSFLVCGAIFENIVYWTRIFWIVCSVWLRCEFLDPSHNMFPAILFSWQVYHACQQLSNYLEFVLHLPEMYKSPYGASCQPKVASRPWYHGCSDEDSHLWSNSILVSRSIKDKYVIFLSTLKQGLDQVRCITTKWFS